MVTHITQEDNLILQSYYTTVLLKALGDSKLEKSEYFAALDIPDWTKDGLREIGVQNQGSALMALYAMFVVPRELIRCEVPEQFAGIESFLKTAVSTVETTYEGEDASNRGTICFANHIRNSVAHARVAFTPDVSIEFTDRNRTRNRNEEFKATLPLSKFGELLGRMQEVHLAYINRRNATAP